MVRRALVTLWSESHNSGTVASVEAEIMHEYARRTPSRLWGVNPEAISDLGKIVGLAFVYFITGKLGLQFASLNQSVGAVWPPTGIALAAVLLLGYRVWPGIWLGLSSLI